MYRMTPDPSPQPGTALVQRIQENPRGFGAYYGTPTYFATPAGQSGIRGLGCGCGCNNPDGMGLFDTGLDFSGWGWQEWGIALLGGYMVASTLFTTKRAARAAGDSVRRARRRVGKRIAGGG